MAEGVVAGRCTACGHVFSDPAEAAAEPAGTPCPECKATTGRTFDVGVEDSVGLKEWIEAKGKRPGKKKPYIETQAGDQLRKAHGDYVDKYRRIDRDNDWYDEVLADDEGHVFHETHERLSEHWGHGSAKAKGSD